jgi:hypothetical protein
MKKTLFLLPVLGLLFLLAGCAGGGVPSIPPAPSELNAERKWEKDPAGNLIQVTYLSWIEVRDATSYKIYRQETNTPIAVVQKPPYKDLIPRELWHSDIIYYVSAVVSSREGEKAEKETEEPLPPPPF